MLQNSMRHMPLCCCICRFETGFLLLPSVIYHNKPQNVWLIMTFGISKMYEIWTHFYRSSFSIRKEWILWLGNFPHSEWLLMNGTSIFETTITKVKVTNKNEIAYSKITHVRYKYNTTNCLLFHGTRGIWTTRFDLDVKWPTIHFLFSSGSRFSRNV